MLGKPIDELVAEDVHSLVRDHGEETQRLEFKREVDLTRDRDKKEFAKDVCGMANGAGGRIVYGIDEQAPEDRRPVAVAVVPLTDRRLVERANNILTDALSPPVRARIKAIDIDGGFVMIVDVPPSVLALHMVGAYGDLRYYMRTEKSVVPMPEVEVHRAYDRIGRLRDDADERVRRVVEREGRLAGRRTTILMIPLATRQNEIDAVKFRDSAFWLDRRQKLANWQNAHALLVQVRPTGQGIESRLPADTPIEEAKFVFRLLTDATINIGSPTVPLMGDGDRFHVTRLLRDVFNATAWNYQVCAASGIQGPSRVVVMIPVPRALTIGGLPEDITEPLVLPAQEQPIQIEYEWLPTPDVAGRLQVVESVMDRLWQHMGRERCDRFFSAPGRLQSRLAADFGIEAA